MVRCKCLILGNWPRSGGNHESACKDLATTEMYQSSTIARTAGIGEHLAGLLEERPEDDK